MIWLLTTLMSVSFADDALDKKVFLLKRAIKNNDCGQASEMVNKLLDENPTYSEFWKTKAEIDQCLNASDFDRYLSYDKYVETGGSRSEVDTEMSDLESRLYSVRVNITSDQGSIQDWSKLKVSLDSDRWVKESDGRYLLEYSPMKEYTLSVVSSDYLMESVQQTLSGQGMNEASVEIRTFEAATVSVPSLVDGLNLQVFPANRTKIAFAGTTGKHNVGAGPARVVAEFYGKTVEYETDFSRGENTLILPWMVSIVYGDNTVYQDVFSPDETSYKEDALMVASPIPAIEELKLSFEVQQQLGQNQMLTLTEELFAKSQLGTALQEYASLQQQVEVAKVVQRKTLLMAGGSSIAAFALAGGVQSMALGNASQANGITNIASHEDFQSLSKSANLQQTVAVVLSSVAVLGSGATWYLNKKKSTEITKLETAMYDKAQEVMQYKDQSIAIQ